MLVVYSNTKAGSPETILPDLKPLPLEHVVKASVDKFFETDLEAYLNGKGIKQVIITGIATEGAVLDTSIGASLRGFKVVVPVDGTASASLYAEQYVAWHLMNAPGVRGKRRPYAQRSDKPFVGRRLNILETFGARQTLS